jgi:hypothetical protein
MGFWVIRFAIDMGAGDVVAPTNQVNWYYYANTRAVQ